MKILMLAPQPFFEPRGTPISVYQRLHGLSQLGHEVDLITYPVGQEVTIPGVNICRITRVPGIKTVKVGPSLAKIPLDILLFFKAVWMLSSRRYDMIHSHEEAAFFAVLLSAVFRLPHLYDMHSSLPQQLTNFGFANYRPVLALFRWLERRVLTTCQVVITIGADLQEHVLAVNPQANHIRIENLAIHVDVPRDPAVLTALRRQLALDGKFPIVYTGTFERYQGLDLLVESSRLVAAQCPDVVFIMVGGKPDQVAYWQDYVRERGLAENFIFVGTVPLQQALTYLELAEVLVSPRTDGLSVPLKIYSYLHSGKPTVATDIKAHSQILSEAMAVLVKAEPADYAGGIIRLITNPPLRRQLGAAAKAHALEHFSPNNYLARLAAACRALETSEPIQEPLSAPRVIAD